ncbi:MAG TPA: hypothetical protein ENI27_07685 [bacterium]|nr:hypothetical protein [bacterium]
MKEILECGDLKLMFADTESPAIVKIVAESGMLQYRGYYSRGLLSTIYRDLTSQYEHFMKTAGFHFTVSFGYDLKEPGDKRLAVFCIEIKQTEEGKKFFKELTEAAHTFSSE